MTRHEDLAAFQAITHELLSLLDPLDDDRMNQVPFPGSWTPGQLGEHLLKSFRLIGLSEVKGTPARRPADAKSPQIDAVFLDFTTKYQPPESIVPSTGRISGRNLVDDLRKAVDGIAAYARDHDLAFTSPEFEVIGFGDLSAQEWLRFLTAHGKRHAHQLRNILSRLEPAAAVRD